MLRNPPAQMTLSCSQLPFEKVPVPVFLALSLSGFKNTAAPPHTHSNSYHKTRTNNLTLVVDKVHSQHFLLAKNTGAISVPLPDCVITLLLPPPWKLRAWLSIRQPDSSCVCTLLYRASKTGLLSLLRGATCYICLCFVRASCLI